jgi:hypothetical protein
MHADTVEGVLGQLKDDLGIPEDHVANVTFIVALYVGRLHPPIRRVSEVAFLQPNGDAMKLANLATWDRERDRFQTLEESESRDAFAAWADLSEAELEKELGKREGFLTRLIKKDDLHPEVTAAVEKFYEKTPAKRRLPTASTPGPPDEMQRMRARVAGLQPSRRAA